MEGLEYRETPTELDAHEIWGIARKMCDTCECCPNAPTDKKLLKQFVAAPCGGKIQKRMCRQHKLTPECNVWRILILAEQISLRERGLVVKGDENTEKFDKEHGWPNLNRIMRWIPDIGKHKTEEFVGVVAHEDGIVR